MILTGPVGLARRRVRDTYLHGYTSRSTFGGFRREQGCDETEDCGRGADFGACGGGSGLLVAFWAERRRAAPAGRGRNARGPARLEDWRPGGSSPRQRGRHYPCWAASGSAGGTRHQGPDRAVEGEVGVGRGGPAKSGERPAAAGEGRGPGGPEGGGGPAVALAARRTRGGPPSRRGRGRERRGRPAPGPRGLPARRAHLPPGGHLDGRLRRR